MRLDEAAWRSRWRTRPVGEKALLCLGLLLVAATARSVIVAGVLLALCLVLALAVARVPARLYGLALLGPLVFVVTGSLGLAVTLTPRPGDVLASLGPAHVVRSGLLQAALAGARSLAATSALLLLALTTPVHDLLGGLRRLRAPEVLIDVALLTYRLIAGLLEAALAVGEAQRARLGYGSPGAARRSSGLLGAAVARRALTRARALEDGLAGRGYTGGALRTLTVAQPLSPAAVAATLALLGLLTALSATATLRGWA